MKKDLGETRAGIVNRLKDRIILFAKRCFCNHEWQTERVNRFAVMRPDGSKEGEVTLGFEECSQCGKERPVIRDRVHFPKPERDPEYVYNRKGGTERS